MHSPVVLPSAAADGPADSLLHPWTTLFDEGPGALAEAVGDFSGSLATNLLWLTSVVVVALVLRSLAKRAITALTHRLADPVRDSRFKRLLTAARGRSETSAPLVAAALTTLVERRRQRARAIGSLAGSVVSGVLVVAVALLVLARAGVPGSTLASVGVLGLAGAVLAQGLAKDILAGAFVLMEDTYGVGDQIDVVFGAEGVVEAIGLRTTRLRSADGTIWHVRHSEMVRIANRTQAATLVQLDVTVGFPDVVRGQLQPGAGRDVVGAGDLARAERIIRGSLDRLDRDLSAARHADPGAGTMPATLAALVPELVEGIPGAALDRLARVEDPALVDTAEMVGLTDLLEEVLADADVPVLTGTVVAGLVGSDSASVTLRVQGRVADTSREQALAVLRRRLFVDVTGEGLSVTFVPLELAGP